ncbi:hypothetical protein CAMGR0001_2833 [Campylobacter gracilis RM3268]|uniref:Uncharacterized protein n=1 Tax=Campylobacter gracilis RM3268 TaxID=553220 RepID=C8PL43_9BACT|nr:hypothetical protein CAMGR0001_2833 [Campylobacter gracilis RM3268]
MIVSDNACRHGIAQATLFAIYAIKSGANAELNNISGSVKGVKFNHRILSAKDLR